MNRQRLGLSVVVAALLGVAAPASAQPGAEVAAAVREASDAARKAAITMSATDFAAIRDLMFDFQIDREQDAAREKERAQRENDRAKEEATREKERAQREREREYSYYDQGQSALDSARWDRAVSNFDRVVELKGTKSDAALYWKAYAQNKLGQRPEALATINSLVKDYPKSRYLTDARALEMEVKNGSGQSANPAAESDEDLKLIAIQTLANNNSEEAVPILQKVLQGTSSPRLKARALFVLAQSNSPKAREVLINIAKGGSNPDLQLKAVQYLGIHGGAESRAALGDIYASSSDVDLKKRILNAFMVAGEKDRLLRAAQTEQNAELRATAVQQLGVMGAHEELWSLYQKESTVDVKKNIIRAMFTGGNITRLSEIARSESNPELRLLAVRNLGVMGSKRTGDTLVDIYGTEKDAEV